MSLKTLKRSALAALVLGGIAVAPAQAAFIVSEASVDGVWFNPAREGRGAQVDFIPGFVAGAPNGILFVTVYLQNDAGAPTWLALQVPSVTEGQFAFTNVPVTRSAAAGNAFGTDTPGVPPATIGTGSITFNSCNDMQIQVTVTTAGVANLPQNQPLTLNLTRGGIPAPSCVYNQPFTACPAGTTAVANQPRTCRLSGNITTNVTLPNSATYILDGAVNVGTPLAESGTLGSIGSLTIEPGTLIRGAGGALDYLVVHPGSKIFAEGTVDAPIVFTSPAGTPGTWGGIFLAGLAPVNRGATPGANIPFEAAATIRFGGSAPRDSSGVLRYVQIRDAGAVIAQGREFNSLTLGGVGAGTVLEYVQAHNGTDDGFEFFGGTVNARYLVATGNDDDSFDFDYGFSGRMQYLYARPDGQIDTADGRCVESDNTDSTGNQDSTPRTQPVISNMSCIGAATGSTWTEGMRLRRGSAGNYFNSVLVNASAACLRFNDTSTYTAVGTPPSATTFRGGFVGCTTNFADGTSPPFTVQSWYNTTGFENATGSAAAALNGRLPVPGGPLTNSAVTPANEAFFENTSYKGAFGPAPLRDWTIGWTYPVSVNP